MADGLAVRGSRVFFRVIISSYVQYRLFYGEFVIFANKDGINKLFIGRLDGACVYVIATAV